MRNSVGLILEDIPEKAALMYQRLPKEIRDQIIWCTTVKDALEVLVNYKHKLTYISLDHDLGGDEEILMHSGNDRSGMEVIRFLEKQNPKDYKDCKIIVHTWNEIAGPRMVERLEKAGYTVQYKPFGM